MEALEEKAKAAYKRNVDSYGFVSAEIIKNAVTGKSDVKETLLSLFDEHNGEYAKRVGIDRTRHSYVRYLTTRKHIFNFLKFKYDLEDIPLRSLTMKFMTDFTFYFSTVLRLKVSAYNDYLILLHKMTRLALKKHILKRDPFAGHKIEKVPVNHRHLNREQFEKLLDAKLPTYRLCHTRDLFVFSVFTGIGRADLANLTEDNIVTKEDGSKWIHIARQKTKAECHIKLLDIPLRIIEKYKGEGEDGRLFYVPQTCNLCRSLKIIAEQCGLGWSPDILSGEAQFCDPYLPEQRGSDRNHQQDDGTLFHTHHPDICRDNQPQSEQGFGNPVRKYQRQICVADDGMPSPGVQMRKLQRLEKECASNDETKIK